jgi:hypothetical protein
MKSGDYPWYICETDGNIVTLECERCKSDYKFNNAGMTINRFIEISEAFCTIHKNHSK